MVDLDLIENVRLVREESAIHADSGDMAMVMQGRKFLALADALIAVVAVLNAATALIVGFDDRLAAIEAKLATALPLDDRLAAMGAKRAASATGDNGVTG